MAEPVNAEKIVTVTPPTAPAAARHADAPRPGFELLLKTESEARRAATAGELQFLIANETMKLARARQVFVVTTVSRTPRIAQVSSIGKVDRDAPRLRWAESIVAALAADAGLDKPREFVLPAYCPPNDTEHKEYPYRFMLWVPMATREGRVFAGMLLAREVPWNEQDVIVSGRLAETYAHAWQALVGRRKLLPRLRIGWIAAVATAAVLAAGFAPVPLTVLAPSEVTSIDPRVIASPMDGVIEEILVTPNQSVSNDQPLVRLAATTLRNELAVAERNIEVAEARLKQVTQSAVADPRMRAEMAVARSELSLAEAKRDYARDLLDRSEVHAPTAGVAVFSDPRDWIGRPVATGERIMEIADPDRIELRIDVPVADAVAVKEGAKVRAFLDSDPLRPIDATVRSVSFEAQMIENNTLAYRIYASLQAENGATRLGTRGTAQVYGDTVPLAFYLLRRPVAAMRQWLGL
jgi:multidrug resistance efflux pump